MALNPTIRKLMPWLLVLVASAIGMATFPVQGYSPPQTGASPTKASYEVFSLDLTDSRSDADAGSWSAVLPSGSTVTMATGPNYYDENEVQQGQVTSSGATQVFVDLGLYEGQVSGAPAGSSVLSLGPKSMSAFLRLADGNVRHFKSIPGTDTTSGGVTTVDVETWTTKKAVVLASGLIMNVEQPSPPANAAGRENCNPSFPETSINVKLAMDSHYDEVLHEHSYAGAFERQGLIYKTMRPAFTDTCVGVNWQLEEQWAGANWAYTNSTDAYFALRGDWNSASWHSGTTTEATFGLIPGNMGGAMTLGIAPSARLNAYGIGSVDTGYSNEHYIMAHELGHALMVNHVGKHDTDHVCANNELYVWDYLHSPGQDGDLCRYLAFDDTNAQTIRGCVEAKFYCS